MSAFESAKESSTPEGSESGTPDSGAEGRWENHPDPLVRRNRQQAEKAFPIIAHLLAAGADIPNRAKIQVAIDHGYPLVAALSTGLGLAKSTVRCLRGFPVALPGPIWLERPSDLLEALDRLSPTKLPRSEFDWKYLGELATACFVLAADEAQYPPFRSDLSAPIAWHIFSGLCSAGYATSAKRLRRVMWADPDIWIAMKGYLRFVATWIESGAGICEMNHHLQNMAQKRLRVEFLERYPAIELLRQSILWRREMEKLRKADPGADLPPESYGWPSLPGLPLHVNDRLVVSLISDAELKREAIRLDHCVDMYFEVCVLGRCHILSFRTLDGKHLSTAAVALVRDGQGKLVPEVRQHRAARNGAPSSGCCQALQETLVALGYPQQQKELEKLMLFHSLRYDEIEQMLKRTRNEPPVELMPYVMCRVIRDAEDSLNWLDHRIAEEEGLYRHRNEQAGERFERLGFEGELTWDRAIEQYLATGDEEYLDEGISPLWERHWRDSLAAET